jgi:hypothetical protein
MENQYINIFILTKTYFICNIKLIDIFVRTDMIPVLENRWLLNDTVLKYYGLRKKPYTFKNTIKISDSTSNIIKSFDGIKDMSEYRTNFSIKKLIRDKLIIDIHSKKTRT